MSNYCLPVILVLSLIASLVVSSSDDFDFMEISEDVPQDVSAVFLPTSCTASGKTPNTMFTFEPVDNDKITILTYPKDLVTFDVDRSEDGSSMILMQWNDDVAKDAKRGGGVRILFPPHQLKQVDAADKLKAQILDGFTEIESLSVSNKATLQATFTNLTVPIRIVSAKSLSAHLTVISNAGFENVQVSAFANLEIQGNVHNQVSVSSYGGLTVLGNVDSGSVSDSGLLYIDGDIFGAVSASSNSKLSAKRISGSVTASKSATVYTSLAGHCDNHVETSSRAKCQVSNNMDEVTVEIDKHPFTLEGTDVKCTHEWKYVILAAIGSLVLLVCVGTCCWWRTRRKRKREIRHAAQRAARVAAKNTAEKNGHAVVPSPVVPAGHDHDVAKKLLRVPIPLLRMRLSSFIQWPLRMPLLFLSRTRHPSLKKKRPHGGSSSSNQRGMIIAGQPSCLGSFSRAAPTAPQELRVNGRNRARRGGLRQIIRKDPCLKSTINHRLHTSRSPSMLVH
jgi:hypothetical protein